MEELVNLSNVLSNIKSVSKTIVEKSVSIMKEIESEQSEIVDDFLDALQEAGSAPFSGKRRFKSDNQLEKIDREAALILLQDASLELVKDAERVIEEIDTFVIHSVGQITINSDPEKCPFLTEVWNGDIYDKTEIDGLIDLLEDLKIQLSNVTSEYLVSSTVEKQENGGVIYSK